MELLALFLDATYLPTRPSGEKEGVLVAWGYAQPIVSAAHPTTTIRRANKK